jgi:tetratricopeptide (TPR) repeat protein
MRAVRLSASVLALTVCCAGANAQTTYPSPYAATPSPYTIQPLSDADQLAAQIRLLATDPRDLQALVRAGELALKLDDDTAAGAFFARAERIDPNNARVKAGEGSLLVADERPGEALQRFALAERLGDDPLSFAADRGLAYDLVGEQDRAQRDYRLALRAGPNDETQRRYALSLGISGKRDLALAQIDPLLRKSDRGAWRSRAFILAMAGDKTAAEKIATTMMPAGMAQGLQPFFDILPSLGPADRAFAVHFGEVRATPERIADARLVPPLAALAPDPTAPVAVAAVAAKSAVLVDARETRRREKEARKTRGRTAVATATPAPEPLPAPPAYAAQPSETRAALASSPAASPYAAPLQSATPSAYPSTLSRQTPQVVTVVRHDAPPALTAALRPQPGAVATPSPIEHPTEAPARVATAMASTPVATLARSPSSTAAAGVPSIPANPTPPLTAAAEAAPVVAASPPPLRPAPTPVRSEDAILAAIISDIKVPGSEMQPDAAPTVAPAIERVPDRVALERAADDKAAADQKLAEKKVADKKALADKKAADAKKSAADKKLADAKKAAEEKRKTDPKILEPARVWVQVAGGANEKDLPKQWAKLRSGYSKDFAGKTGWTTPLRATNRILTGPFKSEDEAQGFINTIAKDGLSGFVFTSEAGQKITKLAAK